jgi:amidase
MKNLWRLDAADIARLIRDRSVSCVEAVDAAFERLEDVNPLINAVVDIDREGARAEAVAADQALRRAGFEPGPLHGVPVTIKANADQRGRATTNGVAAFRDVIAQEDSAVVANWRRAGAIIVGRTNTPEFSLRWFTDNPLYGATLNPWDKRLTPGGSSGGAAAAVAVGIGALAHGSVSAGSFRDPAFACSVAGPKPSFGRVPAHNPSARGDRSLPQQIVAVQGVLARTIRDVRLGFEAMAVADGRDPWSIHMPFDRHGPMPGARVAVLTRTERNGGDSEIATALKVVSDALRDAGFVPEEASPPRFDEAAQLWLDIVMASNHHNLAPLVDRHGSDKVKNAVRGMLNCAVMPDLATFMKHLARRDSILREWNAFFGRYAAVVMPVSWQPVFHVDDDQGGDEKMREIVNAQSVMLAPSILGIPSAVVPIRLPDGGRQAVQVVGPRLHDEICLALAEEIETRLRVVTPIDPVS